MYAKYKESFLAQLSDDTEDSDLDEEMDFCDECCDIIEDSDHNCTVDKDIDIPEEVNKEVTQNEFPKKTVAVDVKLKEKWEKEQNELRKKTIFEDCDAWSIHHITSQNAADFPDKLPLKYVAGVDISFVKEDNVNACAALVVLSFPDLEVVYEDLSMVELTAPYIPGFLAFREADFLVEKIAKLQKCRPEICPQVIMVDGNGILHPRRCGLAVHLGIAVNLPSLGVAKNLFAVDGLSKNKEHKSKIRSLTKGGDSFPLITDAGETLGVALKSHDDSTNPVFVSPGHKLSLSTALWLTQICCKRRVPEPTRQADIKSREYIRVEYLKIDKIKNKINKIKKEEKTKHIRKAAKDKMFSRKHKDEVEEEVDLGDLFIS